MAAHPLHTRAHPGTPAPESYKSTHWPRPASTFWLCRALRDVYRARAEHVSHCACEMCRALDAFLASISLYLWYLPVAESPETAASVRPMDSARLLEEEGLW
jgi:hypothetical protein